MNERLLEAEEAATVTATQPQPQPQQSYESSRVESSRFEDNLPLHVTRKSIKALYVRDSLWLGGC